MRSSWNNAGLASKERVRYNDRSAFHLSGQAEQIKLASVQALGAVGEFTVGVFHTAEKQYHANSFAGDFEIVSLTGTINTMDGAFYTHLHMSAGNEKGEVFGGHLNRAVISATCEMVITVIDGRVDRFHSEEIGLNLFQF